MERLTKLKASRMKELVIKRRAELEDICYKNHIDPDPSTSADKSSAMIDSGKTSNLGDIKLYSTKMSVHRNEFKLHLKVLWTLVNSWQILKHK